MVAPHYSYLIVKSQIIRLLFTLQRQPAIIYNPSQFLSHINPSFSLLAPSISSKSSISCNGFHSVLNSALFSGGANLLSSVRLISFRLRLAICFKLLFHIRSSKEELLHIPGRRTASKDSRSNMAGTATANFQDGAIRGLNVA